MIDPHFVLITPEQLGEAQCRIQEWEDVFKLLADCEIPSGHELMSLPERVAILISFIKA